MKRSRIAILVALVGGVLLASMVIDGPGAPVTVEIPAGATLPDVARILEDHGVVGNAGLFHLYVRARRADRSLKAGMYQLETGSSMRSALRRITRGEVETVTLTIPEGFTIRQMAPRIAEITGEPEPRILDSLTSTELARSLDVPGPDLEGYLFPDSYYFAEGVSVRTVAEAMVDRYRELWTPERRELLEASERTEHETVTLASIIQAEARVVEEMPRIAGVYHNRLEEGWLLQADPTVLYALGGHRPRLLYAAIDSVEGDPYNTYAHPGLPPGPIGAPGARAIDAALQPEDHDFMFFVARPDGSHVFTRSLAEHNDAQDEARERQ
ncbi:MAG: endolytic transglycosylase MltG [Longimicrobiales bacterium]|nr:endolytic transglycosylase MltG [Longimicrobiales bacterium]